MGRASARTALTGVTLDTGALVALERGSRSMLRLAEIAYARSVAVAVPAGVVAQAWRGGRQARIARLLGASMTEVVALDDSGARAVGAMIGQTGVTDVVDVSVALCARQRHHRVVTSDPEDLRRVDPSLLLLEP